MLSVLPLRRLGGVVLSFHLLAVTWPDGWVNGVGWVVNI
jgi:hypothetical protein